MAKDYAKSFYDSRKWKTVKDGYLSSKQYTCERCGQPADVVHHKRYLTPMNINDPATTLVWENLEALCLDCHNQEHARDRRICRKGLHFDGNGDLVSG